jgi:hypothetical protein
MFTMEVSVRNKADREVDRRTTQLLVREKIAITKNNCSLAKS